MTFQKVHRKEHHQRAERLEARFSPTWTGDPNPEPTAPVVNSPAPVVPAPATTPKAVTPVTPAVQTPSSVAPAPAQVTTATPPVVVAPTTTTPAVAPVVPTTATPSTTPVVVVVPQTSNTPSTSSIPSIVQTTPTLVPTTPAVSKTITPSHTSPSVFRSLPSSLSLSTTSSASPSATAAASTGMATGSIVGIAAASVAGVAIVGAIGIWLLKRYFQSRDHDDPNSQFQRHSWMRNSVALPDEAPSPIVRGPSNHGPSENPRPPTMIERKQTVSYANVGASRGGYPQDSNVGMAYSDYQDSPYGAPGMPSFNPGQHFNAHSPNSAQAFFSPIASPPLPGSPGMASFDETMPAVQHASYGTAAGAPVYFSRHDSNLSPAQPDSAALPSTPNPHESTDTDGYATLDRSSVTPYQAQQYAEISKQLQNPHPQPLAPVTEDEGTPYVAQGYAVQEHPTGPSPFEDPVHEEYQELTMPAAAHARVDSTPPMLPPMRAMSPVGAVGAHQSFAQLTSAFPAAPRSPAQLAFPPAAASPKGSAFSQSPPLSPAVGAQRGQVVSVPESVHAGRETPVQFGFNDPVPEEQPKAVRRVSIKPSANPNRQSVASRRSGKSGRPETLYDEEDAYGGI